MDKVIGIVAAILGLGLLMVVHESGHLVAARAFGMKVLKFSIGVGPAIWRHKPKDSDTIYQVAPIPFMAYVQIHGMNPLEDIDPDDKESYANASLIARITAIFAGPLANYLFASILFLAAILVGGEKKATLSVDTVSKDMPAAAAGFKSGDTIKSIDGKQLETWKDLLTTVQASPDKKLEVVVDREGSEQMLTVTPKNAEGKGLIGISSKELREPVPFGKAAKLAVVMPAELVGQMLASLGRLITLKEKAELGGPIRISEEITKSVKHGPDSYLMLLGVLSTWLAVFNLLPVPALDGGRLMFLGYEAITRRRANAKVEATVHLVGMAVLLMLLLVVSVGDVGRLTGS
ncbi:MAG: site-2 protease family protein [Polyangiaceae bacterium]|nr:site-2 protease family protein [Myxococcales bacterium]MCB9589254.1 site-2 protease family protein [Polyangiaceae bacterium]